jgi:glucuronoarabinoxylan endo-1,4-beta-xylanase
MYKRVVTLLPALTGLSLCLAWGEAIAAKPVIATVETAKMHQEIAGFGASEAYYQGFLAGHPHADEIYDALFGPVNGLHTDFLRLQNSFRYVTDPAHSMDFASDTVAIVNHANALRTSPMTIMMTSWSPPAVLKSNHSEKNGGTLVQKNGKYDYADFAQYWQDSIRVYRALGIDPTYVSIQNEPDWTTDYESCRFNPTEAVYGGDLFASYATAVDAVYQAMHKLPNPPHLVGPETFGIGYGNAEAFTSALNLKELDAVAYHLYTGGDKKDSDTYIPEMRKLKADTAGRVRFQTEYYPEISSQPAVGFQTAVMIYAAMTAEEASLYLNWPYTWPDGEGTLLNVENPGEPAKWKNKNGWAYTNSYYAFKQYSYFIHAHYHRVEAASSNDQVKLSAYLSPKSDKLVVVLINESEKDESAVKLKLGEFEKGTSVIYRSTFPLSGPAAAGQAPLERFAKTGSMVDGTVSLPPHSVATVEITK